MEVGKRQAPERVFVDRVLDDARGGPEVVPVEGPLVHQPFAQPGKIADEQRQPRAGDPGPEPAAPAAGERERPLEDRSAQHAEGEVERQARRKVGQQRQEHDHFLAERVVAERRARQPRVRRGQRARADEDVQDREVHGLLAPVDLGVEDPQPEEEQEAEREDHLALDERAAVLAQEAPEVVPLADRDHRRDEREGGQAHDGCGAAVAHHPEGEADRHRVGREHEAEQARETETAVLEAREERPGDGPRGDADEEHREVPDDRGPEGARRGLRRLDRRRVRGLGAVVRAHGRADLAQRAGPALPVVHRGGRPGHGREQQLARLARRELRGLPEEQDARMVVDGELLLGAVVGDAQGSERGVGGEVRGPLEAEAAVEQRAVVRDRHRKDRRHARDVGVNPVRRDGNPVRLGQRLDDELGLLRRVGIEERHRRRPRVGARVVAGLGQGQPVVPGFVDDRLARRDVGVDPVGGRDARLRNAVDVRERQGPEKRTGEDARGDGAPQAGHERAREERREQDAGQHREARVSGIEVPDRLHHREAVVAEEEEDVKEDRREVEHPPPHDRGHGPGRGEDRRDPEEHTGAPEHEVLDRKEDRAPRPLQRGREPRHRLRQLGDPFQVVHPARIETEGEHARPEKDVGQEDADDHCRRHEDQGAAQDRAAERRPEGLALAQQVHEDPEPERQQQGERRDLAGDGQAERNPREQVAAAPRATLGDAHRAEHRRRGEGREIRVDGPEVRELDPEDAEGHQPGRKQRGTPVREPPGEAVDDPDRQKVEDARERAADLVGAVVSGLAEGLGDGLGEHHRQGAVDEGSFAAVVGIEGRAPRVEVVARRLREGDLFLDHRDEALVRMEVVAGVPGEPLEAENSADEEADREGSRVRARETGWLTLGSGSCSQAHRV